MTQPPTLPVISSFLPFFFSPVLSSRPPCPSHPSLSLFFFSVSLSLSLFSLLLIEPSHSLSSCSPGSDPFLALWRSSFLIFFFFFSSLFAGRFILHSPFTIFNFYIFYLIFVSIYLSIVLHHIALQRRVSCWISHVPA